MANTMMMMASSGTRPMMPRGRRCFLRLNNIMISFSKESELKIELREGRERVVDHRCSDKVPIPTKISIVPASIASSTETKTYQLLCMQKARGDDVVVTSKPQISQIHNIPIKKIS